jgi:CrcB protein
VFSATDLIAAALAVGVLGGLGSVIRHLAELWTGVIPWGILVANSVASFIAGGAYILGWHEVALIVGLAGGLSTFSTFAAQTSSLWSSGLRLRALMNAGANFLIPPVTLLAGLFLFLL